ncbi:hypothetical protein CCH79_00013904 [Gambusia affinis]|uniref:40S ribosomal protein S3a n=2 Tax=Clupeocephala TaxID=186625 RepID=A0A315VVI4_GAMAF|nr:hypothetical protein CCH79_00013904 [Gambusia affinis]
MALSEEGRFTLKTVEVQLMLTSCLITSETDGASPDRGSSSLRSTESRRGKENISSPPSCCSSRDRELEAGRNTPAETTRGGTAFVVPPISCIQTFSPANLSICLAQKDVISPTHTRTKAAEISRDGFPLSCSLFNTCCLYSVQQQQQQQLMETKGSGSGDHLTPAATHHEEAVARTGPGRQHQAFLGRLLRLELRRRSLRLRLRSTRCLKAGGGRSPGARPGWRGPGRKAFVPTGFPEAQNPSVTLRLGLSGSLNGFTGDTGRNGAGCSSSTLSDLVNPKVSFGDVEQTMIEAHVDVKTTDGYLLRLFCVGFTKKRTNQIRKTSYAQHQQVRQIRKKMMEIMTREVQTNDLKEVVNKLIPDSVGKDIEKACQSIYPLHDVYVRKVKMLKKPKFECRSTSSAYGHVGAPGALGKLMELHGEGGSTTTAKVSGDDTGAKVERADGYEPPIQETEQADIMTQIFDMPSFLTSEFLWSPGVLVHFSIAFRDEGPFSPQVPQKPFTIHRLQVGDDVPDLWVKEEDRWVGV